MDFDAIVVGSGITGGWVAKVCTDIPGSSAWFDRGFVTYSNASKQAMLGVPERTLAESGAVRPVAVSARRRLGGLFAQTPCLAELGVEEPFTAWRALIGPPGMPPGAIRYWEKKVEAWSASSTWEDWLAKQYWASHYLGSAALGRFFADATARLERYRDWFAGGG